VTQNLLDDFVGDAETVKIRSQSAPKRVPAVPLNLLRFDCGPNHPTTELRVEGEHGEFEKFDPRKQIRGLTEAARQIQIEEITRDEKLPSLDQVVAAIDETRQKYIPLILAVRQEKSSGSKWNEKNRS
jgi:hypothetical protein